MYFEICIKPKYRLLKEKKKNRKETETLTSMEHKYQTNFGWAHTWCAGWHTDI